MFVEPTCSVQSRDALHLVYLVDVRQVAILCTLRLAVGDS